MTPALGCDIGSAVVSYRAAAGKEASERDISFIEFHTLPAH
jgi:hypothetical protein